MGAGQIGGIATLLDIDFQNAAGFQGNIASLTEAHYVVYFLSHAMMFCVGALIEAHVVITPASCVFGERYKFKVYAGTHKFIEHAGISRKVEHICLHKGYNHTMRWVSCSPDNVAILVLSEQYFFQQREPGTDFIINRIRYGASIPKDINSLTSGQKCKYYGWGSRRNGYLIPLLIELRRVDVAILPQEKCLQMWNFEDKYMCLQQPPCEDDLGSVLVCNGFLRGMMVSRLMDRPCGVGFIDLAKYNKFVTCAVDDARDVLGHDDFMAFDFTTVAHRQPSLATVEPTSNSSTLDVVNVVERK